MYNNQNPLQIIARINNKLILTMMRNLVLNEHNKVPPSAFHTMTLCDEYIVIYGGVSTNERILGDLIFLKMNRDKFLIASYENNKTNFPRPRHSHSAVYLGREKRKLYIFGGITAEGYSDELWSLDVSSKPAFHLLKPTGISNRCRHASFTCRGKLYIYGGFGVNKISQKIQILNDLFVFDIEAGSETTKEITTKGGIDMNNFLFKVVRLTETYSDDPQEEYRNFRTQPIQFAFFCSDLTQFFIYDVDTETFTKVMPKFFVHQPRENFTVDRLSDGRIVLLGGMNQTEGVSYNEAFVLVSFHYTQKDKQSNEEVDDIHYSWNDLDLYGVVNEFDREAYKAIAYSQQNSQKNTLNSHSNIIIKSSSSSELMECGYNGHASVVLPNDHILILGGTMECYFPLGSGKNQKDPMFTRRLKTLDIFNTYQWEKPVKSNSDKLHLYPRILHVSQIIPKESKEENTILFIHGGEHDQKMLCHYSLFDMDAEVWLDTSEFAKDFCPQLKSHACSYIYDPERKEFYIIFSGGMYKEHLSNCEAVTNKQKERCGCMTELINNKLYAYRNNRFLPVNLKGKDNNDYSDRVKRFGHNMVTASDGCIYILCGFTQYIGYLVDIVRLHPKSDVKNKTFYFEAEAVEISKNMPGRTYATAQIVQSNIIVFGGVKDDHTLNDLWVINLINLTAYGVNVLSNWIYPRFGMSSILNLYAAASGLAEPYTARFIIFGGSYWTGKELVYGMTNEVLVFNLKFSDDTFSECDVIQSLPSVYGKGSRRIFHQSVYYRNKMYIFGGPNNLILKMKMPEFKILDYKKSLDEYIKECKC